MNNANRVIELLVKNSDSEDSLELLEKLMGLPSSETGFPIQAMDTALSFSECRPEYIEALLISLNEEDFLEQFVIFQTQALIFLGCNHPEKVAQSLILGPIFAVAWMSKHLKWKWVWNSTILSFYRTCILLNIVVPRESLNQHLSGKLSNEMAYFLPAVSEPPSGLADFFDSLRENLHSIKPHPIFLQILNEMAFKSFNEQTLDKKIFGISQMLKHEGN